MIALAECNTICVKCGIPWQVNPNGWPCQGPLHVTPPIGIISLEAIALGANYIGSKFHWEQFQWEKFHWNKIPLEQNFRARAMAMGNALAKTRLLAVWQLGADGFLPVWLPGADGFLPVWLPPWLETLSGSQPQVQLRRGRHWLFHSAPLYRELALRMVP